MKYANKKNAIKLGNRIKQLRLKSKESLNCFVMNKGGTTTATWSRVENGKTDVKFSSLIKIASMFNITVDELLKDLDFDYTIIE